MESLVSLSQAWHVPALYTFVALTFCVDAHKRVLLVQESKPNCRGRYYVPAGRGEPGEDPLRIAWRVTMEKTGVDVDPLGVIGVEHNPPIGPFPGQLRVLIVANAQAGLPKRTEDRHSMGALWVAHGDVRGLKLRTDDFLPWMDDLVAGQQPMLAAPYWRTLGTPV